MRDDFFDYERMQESLRKSDGVINALMCSNDDPATSSRDWSAKADCLDFHQQNFALIGLAAEITGSKPVALGASAAVIAIGNAAREARRKAEQAQRAEQDESARRAERERGINREIDRVWDAMRSPDFFRGSRDYPDGRSRTA